MKRKFNTDHQIKTLGSMHQAGNSLTNHAARKHVENSICMSYSKNPEIKIIKNESFNKLIYLSGAIPYVVSSRSS